MKQQLAPLRNKTESDKPWEGSISKKPWEYKVTAIIPVIDTYEPLSIIIKLLKLQTIKPYILIIDTGSLPENKEKIESLQDECTEVHSLRLNSVQHPSDFVAMALDCAAAMVRTEYTFYTHSDAFLMKQNVLEELINLCEQGNPVVGYRISPRQHDNWVDMFGHTLLLLDQKIYLKKRIMWNLKQFEQIFGTADHRAHPSRPNFPDTEIMANIVYQDSNINITELKENDKNLYDKLMNFIKYNFTEEEQKKYIDTGIQPLLIGDENNHKRNINQHFDHCRTLTSGLLYSPEYYKLCNSWLRDAMDNAKARIQAWS